MTTIDNRKRVLDMLADGKITADEAERMLTLVEAPSPVAAAPFAAAAFLADDMDEGIHIEREADTDYDFRRDYETAAAIAAPHPGESGARHRHGREERRREERRREERRREERNDRADYDDEPRADASRRTSEEHIFSVGNAVKLAIRSFNGRLEVRAGQDDEVRVDAKIRNPSRVAYRAWQVGDNIFVEAQRVKGLTLIPRPAGVHISVTAPANTTIDLSTSNGRVEVQNIHGSGPVHTSNGRIILENVKGEHEAHTSNGRIIIDGMEGDADVKTSNGSIEIKRMRGAVSAASSNGSISFEGEMPEGSANKFETSNGSVKVKLRGDFGARLTAKTSNGRARTNLPNFTAHTQGRGNIEGTIGDGSGELDIRTTNGSINIEQES